MKLKLLSECPFVFVIGVVQERPTRLKDSEKPNTWKLRCKYYCRNYKTTAMFRKNRQIYLRLSSLAPTLAEETAEEAKLTLMSEGCIGVSGDACL